MRIERFEDIQAWQEARKLTAQIYKLTRVEPFSRDFGLKDQIQRAAVSVMENIAEGFGRKSNQDFLRFLGIAYSSVLEVQSHLYVALDLGYIDRKQFEATYNMAASTMRLIGGFINCLQNQVTEEPRTKEPPR